MASNTTCSADRIRELSAINHEVSLMLQSAGHAINALTNRTLEDRGLSEDGEAQMNNNTGLNVTASERKEAFTRHTEAYYNGLQSITARLRRQAYALEEAGIITSEAALLSSSAQNRQSGSVPAPARGQPPAPTGPEVERITNGGLGSLDVAWLNSRGNEVGEEKEKELMEEARKLLEEILSKTRAQSQVDQVLD